MEWLRDVWPLFAIVFGFIALCGIGAWFSRCAHPNPHYRREVLCRDPMTESDEVLEPATYICYECGKTWRATVRDPAWAPTGVKLKFRGYDPAAAARAAKRLELERVVNELLVEAASRATPSKRRRPRKAGLDAYHVDVNVNTRRPA